MPTQSEIEAILRQVLRQDDGSLNAAPAGLLISAQALN
jgi:hypothetical protein